MAAYVCERGVHAGAPQMFKEFLVLFSDESVNSSLCKLTTDLFKLQLVIFTAVTRNPEDRIIHINSTVFMALCHNSIT